MIIGGTAIAQNLSSVPHSVTPIKIKPEIANKALPYQKNQQLGGNSFESVEEAFCRLSNDCAHGTTSTLEPTPFDAK